jgi:hypothetical protein
VGDARDGVGGVHNGVPVGVVAGKNSWNQYRIEENKKLINYLIFIAILPLPSTRKAAISHHIRATLPTQTANT